MAATPSQNNSQNSLIVFLNDNFNLAIVFVVIIFLTAAYFLVIRPKFEETLVAIKDNIDQQEKFYQTQKQKLADLQAAAALYHTVGADNIGKVNTILPDEYAKEKLFGEMDDILSQQGLILNSLTLIKPDDGAIDEQAPMSGGDTRSLNIPNAEHIGIIQANMSISAIDYAALKNLLPLLESHLQLIDVEKLDFDPAGKSVQLVFNTYYFK